ncbi:MAG: hypothetical protein LBT44_02040 [Clostridiales bacterium]|jgi:hypothetical protein|nr:hypothetical protein [Clostridiales bacterium]
MKKISFMLIVIFSMVVMQAYVLAATKQDLYNLLDDPNFQDRGDYMTQYKAVTRDFINTNSFTQTEIDGMYQDALNTKQAWLATGKSHLAEMDLSDQERLRDMAIAAASRVGATMTASLTDNGWNVMIVSKTGRRYTFAGLGTSGGGASYTDPSDSTSGRGKSGSSSSGDNSGAGGVPGSSSSGDNSGAGGVPGSSSSADNSGAGGVPGSSSSGDNSDDEEEPDSSSSGDNSGAGGVPSSSSSGDNSGAGGVPSSSSSGSGSGVSNPIKPTGFMMDFRRLYGLIVIMGFGLLSLAVAVYRMHKKNNLLSASAS